MKQEDIYLKQPGNKLNITNGKDKLCARLPDKQIKNISKVCSDRINPTFHFFLIYYDEALFKCLGNTVLEIVSVPTSLFSEKIRWSMSRLQSIKDLSKDDLKNLLDSTDYVFLDIDGVLVHNRTPIPGSKEGVAKLRELEKKIAFVSNNTIYNNDLLIRNLQPFGATVDEIVTPNASLLAYLKKIGFKKDIFVISTSLPKLLLKEAGYNVIEFKDICPNEIGETLDAIKQVSLKTLEICKNVGAVLVDHDFNFCMEAAQAAKVILNHIDNVLFLTGMNDDIGNLTETIRFVAPHFYIEALERWTKRKSIPMAKPGLALKDVLTPKFNISDDSRVLFIGDNVYTDIALGVNCGFKTMLVLSGITSENQVEEWKFPENLKPTYIAQSIGEFYENINNL